MVWNALVWLRIGISRELFISLQRLEISFYTQCGTFFWAVNSGRKSGGGGCFAL
jgi:hypothetical protein